MIFIDLISKKSKLFSKSKEILHEFAERVGIPRSDFRDHANLPHYILNRRTRSLAIQNKARITDCYVIFGAIVFWKDSGDCTEYDRANLKIFLDECEKVERKSNRTTKSIGE